MTINADTPIKPASDLSRGDVLVTEDARSGHVFERTVCNVSREAVGGIQQIVVQHNDGTSSIFLPNHRVQYYPEP